MNVTDFAIVNPTPTTNADGWTCSVAPNAFDPSNNNAEFWNQKNASIKQTISNLPAGIYCVSATAVTRDTYVTYLTAAGKSMTIVTMPNSGTEAGVDYLDRRDHCKTWFDAGNGVNKLVFVLNEPTNVEIGLTTGTVGDAWTVWRGFGLEVLEESVIKDVTFNVVLNDNVLKTATLTAIKGETVPAIPADFQTAFLSWTGYDASTVVNDDMVINLTATWNGPFQFSTSYADAKWYDMAIVRSKNGAGSYYVNTEDTDASGAYVTKLADATGLGENAYQWAFFGNPYAVKIYNKAFDSSKTFGATDAEKKNEGIPTMLDGEFVWTIKASTATNNAFVLNVPGTDLYINQYGGAGGSLKFWNSSNNIGDEGSAFTIFEVPTNYAVFVNSDITPTVEAAGKYFVLSAVGKTALGWNEAYKTECTLEQYKSMRSKLTTVLADINNYVLPETGYYRIKSAYYDGYYMTYTESEGNPVIGSEKNAPESVASVVKLTALGNNKYTVTVGGLNATTPTTSTKVGINKTADAEFTPVISTLGKAAFDTGTEKGALHCANSQTYNEGNGYYVVGWTSDAGASQWIVEDATINSISATISDAGYATFNALWPVTIPSGVTVYTATTDGTTLTLNKVTGTIPAATPVILEGNEGTYTFNFADDVAAIASNDLKGTYIDYTTTGGEYVLQNQNDKVGFYQVGTEDGDAKPVVRANRAYLTVPAGGATVKAFFFDGGEDAIKSVFDGVANGAIYDLSGRKVAKLQKGNTYIVNGKTVIVK